MCQFTAYNASMPRAATSRALTPDGQTPGVPAHLEPAAVSKRVPSQASEPQIAPREDGWPLVGVAWQMRVNPLAFMLAAVAKHNGAVSLKLAKFRATLLREPEHIKRVLVDNADNYTKQTRGYAKARIVLGQGLVTSEGELWQRQRRISTPAFSRQRVAAFSGVMTAATEQMLRQWRQGPMPGADRGTQRAPVGLDVFREMMRLTLRIALQTLLGVTADRQVDELSPAVSEVLERTSDLITNPFSLPPWVPTPKNFRLKRAIGTLDRFVHDTIAARRSRSPGDGAAGGTDLLAMLMAARDEQTGQGMSDLQLRDEAVTNLIAGHETTANALTWAFYLLSQNAEAFARLKTELASVLSGRTPTVEDLPRLPYARAVIEESMRLYPPAWMIGRAVRKDDIIGSYIVRAGTFVLVSPYVTHRHPGLWGNPNAFDPMRFIDGRSESLPKFSYLPFGGGQRFCIGANFAMMEAVLILATVSQACQLDLVPGAVVEPYAMITLRPRHGAPMTVRWHRDDEKIPS
jgi:cytochrome P450